MEVKVQVGQEVVVARSGTYNCTYIYGKVARVTPTGQVAVELKSGDVIKFDKHGRERSKDSWRRAYIRTDVEAVRKEVAIRDAKYKAVGAMNAIKMDRDARHEWSKETMMVELQNMKNRLAEAEALVNAIPV